MPPPSQLAIATSVVQRLVREEASYHKELEKQRAHLQKIEANPEGDENDEFQLKQEKLAIQETLAVFPPLKERIAIYVQKLEDQLESAREGESAPPEEIAKAKEVIEGARTAMEDGEDK